MNASTVKWVDDRIKAEEIQAEIDKISEEMIIPCIRLKDYDEECDRGLMHTLEYFEKMAKFRKEVDTKKARREQLYEALKGVKPPFDMDNYTAACGCVIKNGERVKWCGDHY